MAKKTAETAKDVLSSGLSEDLSTIGKDADKIFSSAYKLGGFVTTLYGSLKEIDDTIVSLDQKFAKVAQSMGVGQKYSEAIKQNFAKAAPEIYQMGLGLDDILNTQLSITQQTGKNVIATKDNLEGLLATSKVTGQNVDSLLEGFLDIGMEASHISKEMFTVQKTANNMGVNAKAVSSLVVGNLDKLNKFTFSEGVEGLAKMAGKAAMFRIDMSETFSLAERLLSPENAIEVASALQRLGGSASQLASPLRLMDLAQNNVPELQNQLGKLVEKYTYFDEKTKSFQIMPGARRELKSVGDALGVSEKNLTRMAIEGAKLKEKMSQISFDGLNFSKEQQEQIANLSSLNRISGKYEITFQTKEGPLTKSIDELSKLSSDQQTELNNFLSKQFEEGVTDDPQEKMINLAKEQLGKADQIIAKIDAFKNAIPLSVAGSKVGETYLDTALTNVGTKFDSLIKNFNLNNEDIVKEMNGASDNFVNLIKDVNDLNFSAVLEDLGSISGQLGSIIQNQIVNPAIEDLKSFPGGELISGIALSAEGMLKELISIRKSFTGEKEEDFIWRPGQGIKSFDRDDILVGGTSLMSQKTQKPIDTNLISNTTTTTKTESTVGGEITFKVVVDSSSSKNISITEANLIGERVAAAIKSRPDLQDEFKRALNFSMNEPKPR